jgi:hypothetical protein
MKCTKCQRKGNDFDAACCPPYCLLYDSLLNCRKVFACIYVFIVFSFYPSFLFIFTWFASYQKRVFLVSRSPLSPPLFPFPPPVVFFFFSSRFSFGSFDSFKKELKTIMPITTQEKNAIMKTSRKKKKKKKKLFLSFSGRQKLREFFFSPRCFPKRLSTTLLLHCFLFSLLFFVCCSVPPITKEGEPNLIFAPLTLYPPPVMHIM